jgi:hypothetical protein
MACIGNSSVRLERIEQPLRLDTVDRMSKHTIVVRLKSGEGLSSPSFDSREAAESELNELRGEMNHNSGSQRSWLAIHNAMQGIEAAWIEELA